MVDPAQQKQRGIILRGWPESKEEVPECERPYFAMR